MALGLDIFIGGNLTELRKTIGEAKGIIDDLGAVSDAAFSKMDKKAAATAITIGGLSLAIGSLVKTYGSLEVQLKAIEAVTGSSALQMAVLKVKAQELGAATKFSASEVAAGMGELARSGFTFKQVMASIPGVLDLAAAGAVSVAQAAEVTTVAINGFGLAAEQAGMVADLLAKTANVSAIGIAEIQNSFKYIAPIAASTSQKIGEVATMLAIMGNAGVKSEQAGTTIRAALVSLVKPSDDAAKTMHNLGLSIQNTQGKMLPLSQIIEQLREKTAKMTEVQRANTISTIFGAESMSGIMSVMKLTKDQVDEAARSVNDFDGASRRMADTMSQGVTPAFEQAGGAIETVKIQFGEQFAPVVVRLAQVVQGAAESVAKLPPEMKQLAAAAAGGAVLFTTLAGGLATFGAVARLSSFGMAALGINLTQVAALGARVATSLFGAAAASGALGFAVRGLVTLVFPAAGLFLTLTAAVAAFMAMTRDMARENRNALVELKRESDEVKKLTAEYEKLKAKVKPTADEKKRMAEIISALNDISPELVTGLTQMGSATDVDRKAVERYNAAAERRLQLMYQTELQAAKTARAVADDLKPQLQVASRNASQLNSRAAMARLNGAKENQDIPGIPSWLLGYKSEAVGYDSNVIERAKTARLELEELKKAFAAADKIAKEKQEDYDFLTGKLKPKALPKHDPVGKIVDDTSKNKSSGGKSEAEKASDAALDALNNKYRNLIQLNEAYKGGLAGQKAIWQQFLAEVSKLGPFDRVKEAIADTKTTIEALNARINENARERAAALAALKEQFAAEDREAAGQLNAENLKKYHEAQKQLGDLTVQMIHDRVDAQRRADLESLSYFDRRRAEVRQSFDDERKEANRTYGERLKLIEQAQAADEATLGPDGAWVQGENARRAAAKTLETVLAGIATREKKAADEVGAEWVQSLQEIQGAAASLAMDPSMERIANFAQGLISDTAKLEKWSASIGQAWQQLEQVPETLAGITDIGGFMGKTFDGIGASVEGLVAKFGPLMAVASTVAMWTLQFNLVKGAIEQATKPAQELADAVAKLNGELGDIDSNFSNGLISSADADSQRLQAKTKALGELTKQYQDLQKAMSDRGFWGDLAAMVNPFNFLGLADVGNSINLRQQIEKLKGEIRSLSKPELTTGQQAEEDVARIGVQSDNGLMTTDEANKAKADTYKKALEEALDKQRDAYLDHDYLGAEQLGAEAAAIAEKLKPLQLALIDTGEDAKKLKSDLDDLAKVRDELDAGGRDSWGNRISLADERDLKIQEAMLDLEEKRADALKREKQLTQDIARINDDERKAIAAIQNEGIAERSETETQNKTRRIEEVKAQAQADRDAKTSEINSIEAQMKKEEEATAKAVSNIRIQANERITQLTSEKTKLEAITAEMQKQLDIQRQMNGGQASTNGTAPGGGTYSNSYNSSNTNLDNVTAKPGQTPWYTDAQGVVHYHDQGGTPVPPSGEQWATFKPGEFVLTPPQFNNLTEAAASNARSFAAMLRAYESGSTYSASPARHLSQITNNNQVSVNLGGITVQGGFDLTNPRERKQLAARLAADLNPLLGGIIRSTRGGR